MLVLAHTSGTWEPACEPALNTIVSVLINPHVFSMRGHKLNRLPTIVTIISVVNGPHPPTSPKLRYTQAQLQNRGSSVVGVGCHTSPCAGCPPGMDIN
jgi:hypothetical protein